MPIPVPAWLEKDAQQAVEMCPALALRLATDPKKRGRGTPSAAPLPIPAPTLRTGLIAGRVTGPKSITAG
jgi:hypothetical protein